MSDRATACFFLLTLFGLCLAQARSENWPQWRGPLLNGSSPEIGLPEALEQNRTMVWCTELPGHGAGTPIVWANRVFVSAQETRTNRLLAICCDADSGKILWQHEMGLGWGNPPGGQNDMASPSAVTDGRSVIFLFGTGDLAAFDFQGNLLWRRNLQKDHGPWNMLYLYSSSPLLYAGRLYVQVLHRNVRVSNWRGPGPGDSLADSYLLAIDPATGADIWKHIRPTNAQAESQEAYSTPIPYTGNGRSELLIVGGDCVTGHDPASGREYWRCGGWNPDRAGHLRMVPSVTVAGNVFAVCTPKAAGHVFAIRAGGQGDILQTHVAWRNRQIRSDVCVPLFYRGRLYVLDGDFRKGLTCLDPATGQAIWFTAISSRSVLRSSPTGADGRIYFMNEAGDIWVVSADDGKVLSQTSLGSRGTARASIAVAQGRAFVRTGDRLYAFAKSHGPTEGQ